MLTARAAHWVFLAPGDHEPGAAWAHPGPQGRTLMHSARHNTTVHSTALNAATWGSGTGILALALAAHPLSQQPSACGLLTVLHRQASTPFVVLPPHNHRKREEQDRLSGDLAWQHSYSREHCIVSDPKLPHSVALILLCFAAAVVLQRTEHRTLQHRLP